MTVLCQQKVIKKSVYHVEKSDKVIVYYVKKVIKSHYVEKSDTKRHSILCQKK